jgi:hypothetical protein
MVPQRSRCGIASKTFKETDLKLTQLPGNIKMESADSEESHGGSSRSEKVATIKAKAART